MRQLCAPPPPHTSALPSDALKAKHLDAMATATGWILGVVLAILVGVLLLSAWGTAWGPAPASGGRHTPCCRR